MEGLDTIWLILINILGIILLWRITKDESVVREPEIKYSGDDIDNYVTDFINQIYIKRKIGIRGHIASVPHYIAYNDKFLTELSKVVKRESMILNVLEENRKIVKIEVTWQI